MEHWLRSNGRGYMSQTVSESGGFDDYGRNQDATFKGGRHVVWVNLDGKTD